MNLVGHCYARSILAVFILSFGLAIRVVARDTPTQAGTNPPSSSSFEGQRIVNIAFDPAQQPLEGRELDEILPVKRGELYRASDIRTSIGRLYATGRYLDIQVDASPSAGGSQSASSRRTAGSSAR